MPRVSYNGGTYQTADELPSVGSHAPDVSLVTTKLADVSLANWMGRRKVMNVFPSIDIEACTRSVVTFDRIAREHDEIAWLMISKDLPFAHQRFGDTRNVQHVIGLSAIRHAGFGDNYGVQVTEGPLAGMFAPAVFVLDENNTIAHAEQTEDVEKEPDYGAVLTALGLDSDMEAFEG